ncbi:MAG: diguanylate cyclase [Gammaproteobacteria bacterium]
MTKPRHIMVVDGSSVSRAILARMLRDAIEDAVVRPCASGAEALMRLGEERYDLVTTALLLPDMDGLDLSRQVRRSERHHYTPIVVVSGDADSRLLREGFEAGVTDYFDKSLGYKAFGSFIKAFIQRNAGLVGRVLYVEDSRTDAAATNRILEKHGLQVVHTVSAELAVELLEETLADPDNEDGFDLLITDFFLKGRLTGGDLLYAIRARFHLSQQEFPVLVITGNEDPQKQLEIFHAGANDFVTKPMVEEVLMARVRSLLLVKHQYDALKRQAETMRWVAATDSLTGVRSKRYLLDNGEAFIDDPASQPVWAMLIDIDHFKQINDNLGHITGDHVLAALGELLNETFPDALPVRFGGEEFCVLLPKVGRAEALAQAETLRATVETLNPADVAVTISVGLAGSDEHPGLPLTRFLALADKALYEAKAAGRNRVAVYEAGGASPPAGEPADRPTA